MFEEPLDENKRAEKEAGGSYAWCDRKEMNKRPSYEGVIIIRAACCASYMQGTHSDKRQNTNLTGSPRRW
jgi:hypothetical protein